MLFKFKMLSTTANSSRTIDELDGETAVKRHCFAPDARSAGGASLRGQITVCGRGRWPRDQEKRTRRAALRGNALIDYTLLYEYSNSNQSQNTKRQVDSSALATSLCRQTRGNQPWLGRLGPTSSAAHPARLFAAPDHNNSRSRRLLESLHAQ